MPRLDHTVAMHHRLTLRERALVLLVRELVNDLRLEAGLVPLALPEIEHRLWDIVRRQGREERT